METSESTRLDTRADGARLRAASEDSSGEERSRSASEDGSSEEHSHEDSDSSESTTDDEAAAEPNDDGLVTPESVGKKIEKYHDLQKEHGPEFSLKFGVPAGEQPVMVRVYVGKYDSEKELPPFCDMRLVSVVSSLFAELFTGEPFFEPAGPPCDPRLSFYLGIDGYPGSEVMESGCAHRVQRSLKIIDAICWELYRHGVPLTEKSPELPEDGWENVPPTPLPVEALKAAIAGSLNSEGYPSYFEFARVSRLAIWAKWGLVTEVVSVAIMNIENALSETDKKAFAYPLQDEVDWPLSN